MFSSNMAILVWATVMNPRRISYFTTFTYLTFYFTGASGEFLSIIWTSNMVEDGVEDKGAKSWRTLRYIRRDNG